MPLFKKPVRKHFNPGDQRVTDGEEKMVDIQFNVHKFTERLRPEDPSKVLVVSCFSEFGCEVLGAMYCIPRLKAKYSGHYIIVMGWYGREYLYKHLADEFWEIKEDFQQLRDKSLAFHHSSKNISKAEKAVTRYGHVMTADQMGKIAVGNECNGCKKFWGNTDFVQECPDCKSKDIERSLFGHAAYWKNQVVRIPPPSDAKMEEAKKYLGPNPVAITARNRVTYGRNLQPEFYEKLIQKLREMNYTPVWVGEKQTTLECPVKDVVDLTRMSEARDLELTLAVVSQCKFTIQFWTASTRLAGIMGVPYLIFESPDQLYGAGQEGWRLGLCTFGNKKIALCHYLKVFEDNDTAIKLVESCVKDIQQGKWQDVIGMVDEPRVVFEQREKGKHRLLT